MQIFIYCYRNYRLKKSNKMQQYADIYLLLNYSYMFRVSITPIIRSTSSGTDHTIWGASFFKRDHLWSRFMYS